MDRRAELSGPIAGASRVRLQMFPLLAELPRLQTLCDEWFNNCVPPAVAVFRPALPLVFCGVVHYPDMGGEWAWKTGSLSQNEIYFLVPLERYRQIDGRLEFVEFGAATPYILVDNPESAAAGRERYGMPKEDASFSTEWEGLPWPIGTQRYMKIGAWEPSLAGYRLGSLIDIIYHAPGAFHVGARDDDIVGPPITTLSPFELARVADWLGKTAVAAFGQPTLRGVVARIRAYARALQAEQTVTVFSLRQFPDPELAGLARYQDLVAFRMRVTDVQSWGLLGDGLERSRFRLKLRRSEIRPIVKRLGIKVSQRLDLGTDESFEIADARLPFFAQTDIDLRAAQQLCWRGRSTGWYDAGGTRLAPPTLAQYNAYLGPSGAAFLEPQAEAPIQDVKFMMLPVRREAIARHINALMPRAAPFRVTPLGSGDLAGLRVLAYQSRPRRSDEAEELLWMDGIYLSVSVPVVLESPKGRLVATLMLRDFTTNGFMVQAMRELTAGPTSHADFDSGSAGWFATSRRVGKLLGVSTMGLERTSTSARVVVSPLLDVFATKTPELAALCVSGADIEQLRKEVWPRLSTLLPVLTVGAIAAPGSPNEHVSERLTLSQFVEAENIDDGSRSAPPGTSYFFRFHENESFPFVREAGLVTLARDTEVLSCITEAAAGRTAHVPVAGYKEIASRIVLKRFRIVWESHLVVGGGRRGDGRGPP